MNQLLLFVLLPVALARYLRPNANSPHIVPRKDINGQDHPVVVDEQNGYKNVRVINANDPIAQSILQALDRLPAQQEIIERSKRRKLIVYKDKAEQLREKRRKLIVYKDDAEELLREKRRKLIVYKDPSAEQVQQALKVKRARLVILF